MTHTDSISVCHSSLPLILGDCAAVGHGSFLSFQLWHRAFFCAAKI